MLETIVSLLRLSICHKGKIEFYHQSEYNRIVLIQITPTANANINSLTMTDQIVELKENIKHKQEEYLFITIGS